MWGCNLFMEIRVKEVVDATEDIEWDVGRCTLLWTMLIIATCTMLPMKEYRSVNSDSIDNSEAVKFTLGIMHFQNRM
jgi:hypothetical protein